VTAHTQKPDFVFRAKRTSPFKSAGVSVQSTTGSRGVRMSGSNVGYTMFRGSVKGTGYPLHSLVFPSLPLPCVTVCRHIPTGVHRTSWTHKYSLLCSQAAFHRTQTQTTYIGLHVHSKILQTNITITQSSTHMLSKSPFYLGLYTKRWITMFHLAARYFHFELAAAKVKSNRLVWITEYITKLDVQVTLQHRDKFL